MAWPAAKGCAPPSWPPGTACRSERACKPASCLRLSPPLLTTPPAPSAGRYLVAVGDTFYNIARRYRCTVADLLAHNDRPEPALRVGETLRVPLY